MTPKKQKSTADSDWKAVETPDALKATWHEVDEFAPDVLAEVDLDENGKRRSRLDELDEEPE